MDAELVARQLLRAVRGSRSQVAFSRRLGYRGNPVVDWEAGRRFPTATEALRACTRAGIDVHAAFERFHPATAPSLGDAGDSGISAWLTALLGNTSQGEVAARTGSSRYAVGRVLSGNSRPRLPQFLTFVEALTGRMSDWVAELVDIALVPALVDVHASRVASRRLAFEEPWTEAVLRVLETTAYLGLPAHRPGFVAGILGVDLATEARCLEKLEAAGVVAWDGVRYVHRGALTVDTRAPPEVIRELKAHWVRVALDRLREPREGDLFSYNAFSVTRADLVKIRALHRAYFREVRAIVAASEPAETVALVHVQLMEWPVPEDRE